jgi:beta-mannosidase
VASPKEDRKVWPHEKYLIKGIFNHHDARPGSWDVERGQDGNTGSLWGGVDLVVADGVVVRSMRLTPVRLPDGRAVAEARLELLNLGEGGEFDLDLAFEGATFKGPGERCPRLRLFLPPGASTAILAHTFRKPRWWWTWDQGPSDLYRARLEVRSAATGRVVETHEERFGLREIRVTPGWEFFLNGRRFFPRGSNLIPTQYLAAYGAKEARRDVALARGAHLNALRVHAHVNRREFYDACDEAGVLVWQDFALQWSYERSDAFVQNACRQIKDMVRQFYNHPSIAVWCCHNEPSVNRHELDPVLEKAVAEEDASRHVDIASDFKVHPYPGWYWYDRVTKDAFDTVDADMRFPSEFGAQALPSVAALKRMFKPRELWPPDWKAWALRDFQYVQTFNIAGVRLGRSLKEFVANSQAYQARLVKDSVESYRIRKYAPINGLFHFMLADCWPAITWSVVDHARVPKQGYHALKTACQPLLPVLRSTVPRFNPGDKFNWGGRFLKELIVVNDYPREFRNLKVVLTVQDPRGRTVLTERRTCDVAADCVARPFETYDHHGDGSRPPRAPEKGPLGTYVLRVRLLQGSRLLAENHETYEVVAKKPRV